MQRHSVSVEAETGFSPTGGKVMSSNRWNIRTWIAATACISTGLALGGCPAQSNNGGTAATATPAKNSSQAQVDVLAATPTSPVQVATRNNPVQAPNQSQQQRQPSPYRSSSPLYEAVAAKNSAKVEALVKAGEDPNEFIQDGQYGAYTVMHTAARLGDADIIRVLASNGGKINIRSVSSH